MQKPKDSGWMGFTMICLAAGVLLLAITADSVALRVAGVAACAYNSFFGIRYLRRWFRWRKENGGEKK